MRCNVIFLGTDGVGKTTLQRATAEKLAVPTVSAYFGLGGGWKFGFARRLSVKENRFWVGLFWYVGLPLELLARRLAIVGDPHGVVLIDRIPGKPLLGNPVLRFLYKCILPRPCLVVLLTGAPTRLVARKPEEQSLKRLLKEAGKWNRVATIIGARRTIEIDTSADVLDVCRDRIVEAILARPCVQSMCFRRPRRRVP